MRDLLGVDVDLKDLLPPDTSANGFDNGAEALHVSSFLMEQYLEAADRVLDAAIANGPQPWMIKKRFDIKDEKSRQTEGQRLSPSGRRRGDLQLVGLGQHPGHAVEFPHATFRGKYRFRISGYGFQTDKPVTFHVMAGTLKAVTEQHLVGYYDVPAGKPTVVEFVERLEREEHHSDRRGRTGRDPARGREGGGGELQGAGPGRAVGGDRRAAARLLAAAQPSPHLRRPAAGAGPDRRRHATAWRSSRRSRWSMPSASSATSRAAPSGGR